LTELFFYLASGDIRSTILTVNGLPEDYAGQLDITLDDSAALVSLRNILLLSMLGKVCDTRKASDAALQFWFSAFLNSDNDVFMTGHCVDLLKSRRPDGTF
jgi:hypothetical protein